MIYHDMGEAELSQFLTNDDTGWLALSGAILESSQGFPDTTFIEGKHSFFELNCLPCFFFSLGQKHADLHNVCMRECCVETQESGYKTRTARQDRACLTSPTAGRLWPSDCFEDAKNA